MNDTKNNNFIGYEYTTVHVSGKTENLIIDGYRSFGWKEEGRESPLGLGPIGLKFKRDRKIRNKAELSRLQREFDGHIKEMETLETSKITRAQITSLVIGFLGTAFLTGAVFSYLGGLLPLMVILAIPGFIGWILPYFSYKNISCKRTAKVSELMETHYDAVYEICEKANGLLAV